jgi:hypothetical protein
MVWMVHSSAVLVLAAYATSPAGLLFLPPTIDWDQPMGKSSEKPSWVTDRFGGFAAACSTTSSSRRSAAALTVWSRIETTVFGARCF